jgi:hypothetical protein
MLEEYKGTQEQFKKIEGKNIVLTHVLTGKKMVVENISFEKYCQIDKSVVLSFQDWK